MRSPGPRAITLTFNTGIDHVLEVERLELGAVTRASRARLFAAGKGVNVARALACLGKPVLAFGFAGEDSRATFESAGRFTWVPGASRINTTIRDRSRGLSTHVIGTGYSVSAVDCERLLDQFRPGPGDVVALSGSLPPGAPPDLAARCVWLARERGAWVLVDTSGQALLAAIAAQPDCVKPNVEELREALGEDLPDTEDALSRAAAKLVEAGARRVVVSRAGKGAFSVSARKDGAWRATCAPRQGDAVGCGDALVAGLLAGVLESRPWPETLALGVACGAANLQAAGPGLLDMAVVREIEHETRVERIGP